MRYTRANDHGTDEIHPVKLAPDGMEGVWFNCDPATGEIRKIVMAVRDGAIFMRAFGANKPDPIVWEEVPVKPYVECIGSSTITGLTADYDFGFMKTRLAGNIKYGVLVIQSYNEFCDGSGRPAYLTREFFSKEVTHEQTSLPPVPPCAAQSDLPTAETAGSRADLAHLAGHWTNTNPETTGITQFDLTVRDDRYFLRVRAAGRAEPWDEVEVIPHAYNANGGDAVAFHAQVDFGFTKVTLAANENKGLVIIASYHRFQDGSARASYFKREFFYRADAVQR